MGKDTFFVRVAVVFLLCLVFTGCTSNQEELEKKILEQDASFKEVIAQRDALRQELASKKENLQKNKLEIDNKINVLREKQTNISKVYAQEVEKIKNQIEPEKRKLTRALFEYERDYKRIIQAIQEAERDIKDINVLMEKKETLALTQEEIKTWKDRRASLIEDKQKLEAERVKVKREIELNKMKNQVLTL